MSETLRAVINVPQASPGAFFAEHREEVAKAVSRVLDSGWYILGTEVEAFEEEFARQFDFAGAVGVGNGTDAIALALRSIGVGPGDRVATVSHTAVATVAAIEMVGGTPVFVDIVPGGYTMDPTSLLRTIEARHPIKAVIAVHLYGHPADLPRLLEITNTFQIPMIEDCAQCHGAKLDGRFVGSVGRIATFSFYPTKNLGAAGDGGMVACQDAELLKRVRASRQYGWESRYISESAGINSRLDELQAAILRVRLPYLDEGNDRRIAIAHAYGEGLARTSLALPTKRTGATHVYHQYVVRSSQRDHLRTQLRELGIGTNIHYPVPVHMQPAYAGRCEADPQGLPITEGVAGEILSLPMYPEMSDAMVANVIEALCSLT